MNKFVLLIDAGGTYTHSIILVDRSGTDSFRTSKCNLRHQLQVTPHLILARNANENPSSETSRPLVTSSLARSLRGLTYSTLKFMRSTCGKANRYRTIQFLDHFYVNPYMYVKPQADHPKCSWFKRIYEGYAPINAKPLGGGGGKPGIGGAFELS